MEKKQDLRITKTYMALTNTFFQMMEEMQFDKITVKELCDRAMIRKSTFYKHFADKYELFTFIIRETQAEFDEKSAGEVQSDEPIDFYKHLFSNVVDFADENTRLIQSAIDSNSLSIILSMMSEQIIPDVTGKLKEDKKSGHEMIASPEVIASLFTGGLIEVIKRWILEEKPISKASLKRQISDLITAVYTSANPAK